VQYQLNLAKEALVGIIASRLKELLTEKSLLQPSIYEILALGEAVSICTHLIMPILGSFKFTAYTLTLYGCPRVMLNALIVQLVNGVLLSKS